MSRTTSFQDRLFDESDGGEVRRRFLVQKHDATRLHYDFRLEHDGVFKSWVLHDGPCLDSTVSRHAVLVKDHRIGAGEGTIPQGVYGAGTIMIWDLGFWLADQNVASALYAGELRFRLFGKKLNGIWSLTRLRPRPGERRENWLLKKALDEEARSLSELDILVDRPESVWTGRTLAQIALEPPPFVPAKRGARRGRGPTSGQLSLFAA